MEFPVILAGLNDERIRKIAFYLRHDSLLVCTFSKTLLVFNLLAEMITSEMKSNTLDQDYWKRIGSASGLEIFVIKLLTHGPSNFARLLYGTITNSIQMNTSNEADEVEHHLSILRAKMNDLSCLLASVNDAVGLLKRSFLVSNNRHYLYLICETNDLHKPSAVNRTANNLGSESAIELADSMAEKRASELLAPLRTLCQEDIRASLDSLLSTLGAFSSIQFTPRNIPCVSPRFHTHIPASTSSSGMGSPRSQPRVCSPAPINTVDSSPHMSTVPPCAGSSSDSIYIDTSNSSSLAQYVNEKLVTIVSVFNEIAPYEKSPEYPLGISDGIIRKPTSYERYWILRYTMYVATGLGCYYMVHAFRTGELQSFITLCIQNMIIKFKEHVVEPLDKLSHELFDSKFKEGIIVTKEDLQQSYVALSRMLDDYSENVINKGQPNKADQLKTIIENAKNDFLLRANLARGNDVPASSFALPDAASFSDSKIVRMMDRFSSYVSNLVDPSVIVGNASPAPVSEPAAPASASTISSGESAATMSSAPVANNSLQPFDLKGVGTMVVAPSPNTTRSKSSSSDTMECYTYKKLTPLDIVEMQTKSSVVMEELMKDYEEELKNPIKGMISGNLMRSMLIQVQKLKVHTEAAMLTMDQILASNELTIAATAALPAIAILGK